MVLILIIQLNSENTRILTLVGMDRHYSRRIGRESAYAFPQERRRCLQRDSHLLALRIGHLPKGESMVAGSAGNKLMKITYFPE